MQILIDTSDLSDVKKMVNRFNNIVEKVERIGLSRALTGVKTDFSTEIRSDLNISKKYVDSKIKIFKPLKKVSTISKPVGLINFTGSRQTKKGVSVKVKKTGRRKILRRAFIVKAKKSENVYWREYSGKRSTYDQNFQYGALPYLYRFPIKRLTGPRLTDRISEVSVYLSLQEKAAKRYIKEVDRAFYRELAR